MTTPRSRQLLSQVATRQRLAAMARWFYWALLGAAAVYAGMLLISRLFGVMPDGLRWWTLLLVPGLALLIALVFHRGSKPADAARLVDQRLGTKDLYLTVTLIDKSAGEYQPLVVQDAETRAPTIRPETVVPFDPWARTGHVVAAVALLILGVLLLPQLDPFGRKVQETRQIQRRQRLEETRLAVAKKAEVLVKKEVEARNSPEVAQAVEQVKSAFKEMKPQDQPGNLRKLENEQKNLSEMWQKTSRESLPRQADRSALAQQFGAMPSPQANKINQELKEGKTDAVKREIADIKDKIDKLQQTQDPKERKALEQQIGAQTQQLADALTRQMSTPELDQALKNALEQMQMAQMQGLSEDALKGLKESLNLTQMEAQSLAQKLRDLQSLKEGLQALQAAKQANQKDPLDGKDCGQCNSLEDYAKLYGEMCKGAGQGQGVSGDGTQPGSGNGGGMGGPGIGRGGVAPENANANTNFTPEQARSQLTAGKTLMQWKTKGMSEKGQSREQYQEAVHQVKQGVSEAILRENVPAGLHDTVKGYFDKLPTEESKDAPKP